jgi:TonB dependent receptor/CarboxypepD_reg-like domain/TonB-dependent Receptor Plug Domain
MTDATALPERRPCPPPAGAHRARRDREGLWNRLKAAVTVAMGALTATASAAPAQEVAKIRLSGYIRNGASGEVVRYAMVAVDAERARSQSNEDGYYFLLLSKGQHALRIRALGYAPLDTVITLTESRVVDLRVMPTTVQLASLVVEADREAAQVDPKAPEMSVARLDLKTIRQAPSVLGEVDPIRSLTLLPGVSRSSDASTAFSVRGGSADQNLILLDEATIYNPAHVLGFLSVFNSDAIDDVTLYKGAIPARLGGRLSSVVDIRQREGNANEFAGSANIGLLASRGAFEGPLPGKRGSFLVAARRSYADLFLKASPNRETRDNVAYFYDLNAKMNIRIGQNGVLMLSQYGGRDKFSTGDATAASWGNQSWTARWNQIVANRLFSKVMVAGSDYDYQLGFDVTAKPVRWTSRIRSLDFKLDQAWHLADRNIIEFGAEYTAHDLRPGDVVGSDRRDTVSFTPVRIQARQGVATALHIGHEVDLGRRLSIRYGVRYSAFDRRGAATIYRYADGKAVTWNASLGKFESGVVVDSTRFAAGQSVTRASGLEPRISLRLGLTDESSLKASYARTIQYLNLASRTNTATPLDVWEPIGPSLVPQRADQMALGYASTMRQRLYEFSVEAYYKRLYNTLDFIDGSDVLLNPRIETAIVQGDGRAYGLELYLRKRLGTTTGWISYTVARAENRVRAPGLNQGINDGAFYPAPSDKTHELSVVAIRPLGKRWTLGSTFSLASGLPTTYPKSRFVVDGLLIAEFGARNAARLPLYHRLDMSASRKWGRGELQVGVYNIYNRFNAQSISFRQSKTNPLVSEAVRLSIFGAVPSLSYSLPF